MTKLIRVSVDMTTGSFIIEKGEMTRYELTEAEKKELANLREQLHGYGDFVNLGQVAEAERNVIMAAQKRRAELEQKPDKTEIIWHPVPKDEVESVIVVLMPQQTPIYVENMPVAWIQKLFKSEVIIQDPRVFVGMGTEGAVAPPAEQKPYEKDPSLSEKHNHVRQILYDIKGTPQLQKDPSGKFSDVRTYLDCVTIREGAGFIIITPKKWLAEDWGPINNILKENFSGDWIREGKTSHWKVKV